MDANELAAACSAHMHSNDHCSKAMGMQIVDTRPGCATLKMPVNGRWRYAGCLGRFGQGKAGRTFFFNQ